ncbi:Pantothenate kinase type III, CoaX-like [uncultured Candidatus Thioglobus sp.]|nr:Pantothenate kinase type III, CoaX-like [uncultured Candidatus Thioglobus sp.]
MDSLTLLVDIGNSTISWEIDGCYTRVNIEEFQPNLLPQHQSSSISCVANHTLIQYFSNPIIIKPFAYKGLIFDYNLEQLGTDRFLGIVAGVEKYKQQDFMLIDIGTFITIDSVKNNCHIDGGIAPGLLQLQQIHQFEGDNSQKSWKMGVENMLCDYIKRRCGEFQGKILITGGNQQAVNIEQAEYCQNLVITGLKVLNEK